MTEQQTAEPIFSIEKIYTRDISLESPNAPQIFLERENPTVEMQLRNEASNLEEGLYDVLLTVTVTAKVGDKTMFLAEAGQAGIFQIRNLPADNLEPVLGVTCPNILFPYVRETISDLVTRAGFPPVLLAPVNFEAMYLQRLQAQQEALQGQSSGEIPIQ
ncbi:MAG: protein-export chaperone SecB [Sterolibacterium sp.]|jgi:preprotein translocase subunit SecB|nr:protein-export chaperone SecB [Sterolibacterium sp.]MBP9799541.1 protein-export chaperone SecB [Sterolibacterium sp.]